MFVSPDSKSCCHFLRFICAVAAIGLSSAAVADADVDELVLEAARRHLESEADRLGLVAAQGSVQIVAVRQDVSACSRPVEVVAADTRVLRRMRFVAKCVDAPGWQVEYVLRAELSAEVVVAVETLSAARPVAEHEVTIERRMLPGAIAPVGEVESVVGQAPRRAIRAGQIVDAGLLQSPVLVRRGQAVSIVARNDGIVVTAAGEALQHGRRGEVVNVRNSTSASVIRARVIGENTVEPVDLFMPPPHRD